MNNNTPLVSPDPSMVAASQQPSVSSMPQTSPTDNANVANNSLNTFQDIQKGAPEGNAISDKGIADAISDATKNANKDSSSEKDDDSKAASDERMKELFGDRGLDIVDCIAKLNAYRFKYKPGMEKVNKDATPDKEHVGIIAQELQANPVTKNTVEKDPLSGFLQVDTKELSTTMMAILTAMAKKIQELEAKIK